jgi:hypothetical protein
MEIKTEDEDLLETHKKHSFKPMRGSVLDEIVDQDDGNKQNCNLEVVEHKSHIRVNPPADEDRKGKDEESDLHARTDGDTDGQIHFILDSNCYSRSVLSCVTNDRKENQPWKYRYRMLVEWKW